MRIGYRLYAVWVARFGHKCYFVRGILRAAMLDCATLALSLGILGVAIALLGVIEGAAHALLRSLIWKYAIAGARASKCMMRYVAPSQRFPTTTARAIAWAAKKVC